jgi:hypothetical protein
MPTLLLVDGFRFYFFSLEGTEPPHVHARKGGGKAKLWLTPVTLVYARGLTKSEERRVQELTRENAEYFLTRWNEYFNQ